MKFPTIEEDGSIGEIETDGVNEYFIRPKIMRSGMECFSVEQEAFKGHTLAYRIQGNRRVKVAIYVNVSFLRSQKDRSKLIQSHLEQFLPWIFSYGQRSTDE